MLVLAMSDIHQRIESLEKLIEKVGNEPIELAIIAGDLTNYGDASDASEVLNKLPFKHVLAVPGNMDTKDVLNALEERKISLHGRCASLFKYKFCGFGGGLIGSAGSLLFSELEIEEKLRKLVDANSILVTHLPPKNTKLDETASEHIGSNAIRNIILEKKPLLHICGHVHEASGKIKLGSTTCINVAAVKNGQAFLIELKEAKISVKKVKV